MCPNMSRRCEPSIPSVSRNLWQACLQFHAQNTAGFKCPIAAPLVLLPQLHIYWLARTVWGQHFIKYLLPTTLGQIYLSAHCELIILASR